MIESLHFFPFVCFKYDFKHDQNIVLGYTLEVTCTHNQCFREEMKKVYPSKSKFSFIKVEFKGCLIYTGVLSSYEPRREKTGFLHMRKQRRRSASR